MENHNNTPIAKDEGMQNSFDSLAAEGEFAERASRETIYTGFFLDKEALYKQFPPSLEEPIGNPHVTVTFRPNATQLHLEELGVKARIFILGYGNDGDNEGLLVRAETDDPALQSAIDQIRVQHITLSCSKDGEPKDTADITYERFDNPIELKIKNAYGCFVRKTKNREATVVTDKKTLAELLDEE